MVLYVLGMKRIKPKANGNTHKFLLLGFKGRLLWNLIVFFLAAAKHSI